MDNFYNVKDYKARRSVGYLIRSCSNMITTIMEDAFSSKNVSFIQFVILMNLRDKMATTAAELCEIIRHDSGALTRVLDQLEESEFIKRERSKEDRRVVELKLTSKGLQATDDLLPIVVEKYNYWLSDFTPAETEQLLDLLTRMKTTICQSKKAK